MTILLGTITSGGTPVTGTLYLQLSQDATLNGGVCGSGSVSALPPFVFNLQDGILVGPGTGAYTVPGADCLTPAGLTYHMTVTGPSGGLVLERDVTITGAYTDIGTAPSVDPTIVLAAGAALAGDLSGSSTAATVVGLQGRTLADTEPNTGEVVGWNGSAWAPMPSSETIFVQTAESETTPNVLSSIFGTGVGSRTIPANRLRVGSRIRITARGYTNYVDGAQRAKEYKLLGLGRQVCYGASTNQYYAGNWALDASITVLTLGPWPDAVCVGTFVFSQGFTTGGAPTVFFSPNYPYRGDQHDTTVANPVEFTYNSGGPGTLITSEASVEILR